MVAAHEAFEGAVLHRLPRQARSRDKVVRGLAAAERLLEREGPSALTVTAVAREADVSVGALHQYLPDREAMTRALLTRYHARFEALLDDLVDHAERADRWPDGDDPIAAVLQAFAGLHRRSAGVRALRGDRAPEVDRETREHKARMATLLERLMRAHGLLEGLPPDRAALVARTVFATADALMHEAFRDDPHGDRRMLDELLCLLRAYLEAAAADGAVEPGGPTD